MAPYVVSILLFHATLNSRLPDKVEQLRPQKHLDDCPADSGYKSVDYCSIGIAAKVFEPNDRIKKQN